MPCPSCIAIVSFSLRIVSGPANGTGLIFRRRGDGNQNPTALPGYRRGRWQNRIKTVRCICWYLSEIGVARKELRTNGAREVNKGLVNRGLF